MIARITGKVIEKSASSIIIETGGIGYELIVPTKVASHVIEGETKTLFVAEHIKEDEYSLFGFDNPQARRIYYQLTSVNGVGPKAAMSILSTHSVDDIQEAILKGNIAIFSAVSGVGRKTAQRIILELKGKLELVESGKIEKDQAYQALMNLGYSSKDATEALKVVDKDLPLDEQIKQALKGTAK